MTRPAGKLPAGAEALLKVAAQVGQPGSLARRAAIERAIERVQQLHPEHFRSETRT